MRFVIVAIVALSSLYANAEQCANGKWGVDCDKGCPTECKHMYRSPTCDKFEGFCINGCQSNMYGDFCNRKCPDKCQIINLGDTSCNQSTGNCDKCMDGYFGDRCEETCPSNCLGRCDKLTGKCDECKMGFFSQDCSKNCPANCLYGKCDFKLGNCTSGCAGPYFGQFCDQSACPHQAQYDAAVAFSIVFGILFALSTAGWAAHVYRTKKQGGYHLIKTNDIN